MTLFRRRPLLDYTRALPIRKSTTNGAILVSMCAFLVLVLSLTFVSPASASVPPTPRASTGSQAEPAPTNSSEPPPPPISKSSYLPSAGPTRAIPKGTPLATPSILPNGTVVHPCVSSTCDHNWDIVYYSQNANDYGGTFIAQANNIGGWKCSVSKCTGDANDVLILPLNIDVGTDPGSQVWFQFDLDFSQYCTSGVCSNYVYFLIWDNPNPTGYCGPRER